MRLTPHRANGTRGERQAAEPLLRRLGERAARYLGEPPATPVRRRLVSTRECRNSWIFRVRLDGPGSGADLLVKTPFARHARRAAGASGSRPRTVPQLFPRADPETKARVEHRALVRLQEHFEALGDERFGVLRVFDYLPEERALVLEEVAAPTLSQLLALSGSRARPALAAPWPTIFRNAGAWLLECHGLPPLEHTRPRQETRDEFVALMESFAEFLAASVGRKSFFRRLVETVRAAAVESLDATLPLAMAHSDYAPNNVFVGAGGRVTVFDTTGRWQAPIYEDLGHFLVGLKAASRQVYRPGAAWRAVASPHEAPFLQGYFGSATIPWTAVRLFELEAVLDRWAGLCRGAQRSTGVRRAAKRLRLAWWSMFLGRYAARLLAEIVARPPAPSAAVPAATLQEARN